MNLQVCQFQIAFSKHFGQVLDENTLVPGYQGEEKIPNTYDVDLYEEMEMDLAVAPIER